MDQIFRYIACDHCVCGGPLHPSTKTLVKKTVWGEVTFKGCPQCGSMIQSPAVALESLSAWYDSREYQQAHQTNEGVYLDYEADEAARKKEARRRYRKELAPLLTEKNRVLEIGPATGSLLAVCRDHGHEVVGVDLSASFAEQAKRFNDLEILVGDFLEYMDAPASFDLVLMLGTISNIANLGDHLEKVFTLLKPGGHFYFNLPVRDSWPARIYGDHFWMYTPSVMTFFSREGCRLALSNQGFQIVKTRLDRQRPTIGKLLGHGKLHRFYPFVKKLGLEQLTPPFSFPVPGVRSFLARK